MSWYKNDVLLKVGGRIRTTSEAGVHLLQLDALEDADAGTYTCVTQNELGAERCDCFLRVLHGLHAEEEIAPLAGELSQGVFTSHLILCIT